MDIGPGYWKGTQQGAWPVGKSRDTQGVFVSALSILSHLPQLQPLTWPCHARGKVLYPGNGVERNWSLFPVLGSSDFSDLVRLFHVHLRLGKQVLSQTNLESGSREGTSKVIIEHDESCSGPVTAPIYSREMPGRLLSQANCS